MTSPSRRQRVAVIYGGRSGEHEISLISAASVVRNLDAERFELVPVSIDRAGRWRYQDAAKLLAAAAQPGSSLPIAGDAPQVVVLPYPNADHRAGSAPGSTRTPGTLAPLFGSGSWTFDVAFPVLHGPLGEDGTVQGLFELAEVPFVGAGVLGSALGMDKDVAKRLAQASGLPVVPWICIGQGHYARNPQTWIAQIERELGFPCFVKPANMGSSVGVHKVKRSDDLSAALSDAFRYDLKVIVERGIDAREIEVAVLEHREFGQPAQASLPGEIVPTHEFYSYEAKYLDQNGAALVVPAQLPSGAAERVRELAARAFAALECEGMARVDFFMDRKSGELYLNEVNTIPGFTQISMYPRMWEASGVSYRDLLTRLIDLAFARADRKRALAREFAP